MSQAALPAIEPVQVVQMTVTFKVSKIHFCSKTFVRVPMPSLLLVVDHEVCLQVFGLMAGGSRIAKAQHRSGSNMAVVDVMANEASRSAEGEGTLGDELPPAMIGSHPARMGSEATQPRIAGTALTAAPKRTPSTVIIGRGVLDRRGIGTLDRHIISLGPRKSVGVVSRLGVEIPSADPSTAPPIPWMRI